MAEDAEISVGSDYGETVERLLSMSKKSNRATGYLNSDFKKDFIQLKQTFTQALILQHFDPKRYIRIQTDTLDHAIGRVLSQLILNNLG